MPTGVPRSNYTGPLAKALGFRRPQQLRDILKAGGIFPYTDKERASLELLVQKGYRDRLRKYRPLAQDAQVYFDQAIANGGAPPPATPASASSGQLTLMPAAPSAPPQTKTAVTAWDQKLTPRLARLLARSYPDMEFEALKRMARKIMRDAGMEARSEDEAQALAAFRAAGHSIEGFEYHSSLPVDEPTIETAQWPADLENLSPQQLRHEIVKLRERLTVSGRAQHRMAAQKARAMHLLTNAEILWWDERGRLLRSDPNIRAPSTSETDHLWQLAKKELERNTLEDT